MPKPAGCAAPLTPVYCVALRVLCIIYAYICAEEKTKLFGRVGLCVARVPANVLAFVGKPVS